MIAFKLAGTLAALWLLSNAVLEFYAVAVEFGNLTIKWKLASLGFLLVSLLTFGGVVILIWLPAKGRCLASAAVCLRQRLGMTRWAISIALLALPPLFLQYTHWGNEFSGAYIRLLLYLGSACLAGVFLTPEGMSGERGNTEASLVSYTGVLLGLLLSGALFSLINAFLLVTDYPLSLTWSEGNRMWDYSILFGRERYIYPADQPIYPFVDLGRQLLWGLPFLYPDLTIFQYRLWNALVSIVPYIILGWVIFRRSKGSGLWFLMGLWTMMFLRQGPIYSPLILSAILVVIAWRSSYWLALPLIAIAGYYSQLTRINWIFAPALWAGMLIFAETSEGELGRKHPWGKAFLFALSGLVGSILIPRRMVIWGMVTGWLQKALRLFDPNTVIDLHARLALFAVIILVLVFLIYLIGVYWKDRGLFRKSLLIATVLVILLGVVVFILEIIHKLPTIVAAQPLLWQRLLPTPTYRLGLLPALVMATGPLILWLACGIMAKQTNLDSPISDDCSWRWHLDWLRLLATFGPALAFLAVGLVASVKMGGGNNLHNLDTFLVDLVFVTGLAWYAGGERFILQLCRSEQCREKWFFKSLLLLLVTLPALLTVLYIRPLYLPEQEKVENALYKTIVAVAQAKEQGEVLFIDQRQLLTFGYIQNVPLVPEYEKKYLMDRAISGDQAYFEQFYRDLANHRFALIVSEPLKVKYNEEKDADYGFGEENDAWVYWVARPILQYYQPLETFKARQLQLLVPRVQP